VQAVRLDIVADVADNDNPLGRHHLDQALQKAGTADAAGEHGDWRV
jgi:hypothetical protein